MTIKISHQNQDRSIRLSKLPVFENTTVALLKKTDAVKQNEILNKYDYDLTSTLQGRAESIETVRTALNEIQEHKTREVICACLKTALACAIIAGIALVAVFGGELALPIALLVGLAGTVVSSYIAVNSFARIALFMKRDYWAECSGLVNPACLVAAPIIPLYEVLTRQGRIERVQNKQNTEMNKDLITFLQFAEELSKNLKTIRQQLQDDLAKKEQYINQLKPQIQEPALSEATDAALIMLEAELEVVRKTQEALTAFETFGHDPMSLYQEGL